MKTENDLIFILNELAEFAVLFENIEEKFIKRYHELQNKLDYFYKNLEAQEQKLQTLISQMQFMFSADGIAQWRIVTKKIYQESHCHWKEIQTICDEENLNLLHASEIFKNVSQQICLQFSQAEKFLQTNTYQKNIAENCQKIETLTQKTTQEIQILSQKILRKNTLWTIFLAITVAMFFGLYDEGEWPWDTHQKIAQEKQAGEMLLSAWPKLTIAEQQKIIKGGQTPGRI